MTARTVWGLFLVSGCGYSSYYPSPLYRNGSPIDGVPIDTGGEARCSDPAGLSSGEQVLLTVTCTAPVQAVYVDVNCQPGGSISLLQAGDVYQDNWPVGSVFSVQSPSGEPLSFFQIPSGTGGSWSVEVP